jgi:septum site-determining protein MinC
MSKIAIISQPDQGVLIDVGGCHTMQEAASHLTSTLQVSSQFWKGVSVAINLGTLELTPPQVAQLLAISKGVGAYPTHVYSENEPTRAALRTLQVPIGKGKPMTLPSVSLDTLTQHELIDEDECDQTAYRGRPVSAADTKPVRQDEAISLYESQGLYETQDTEDFAHSVAEITATEAGVEEAGVEEAGVEEAGVEEDGVGELETENGEDDDRLLPPKPLMPPVPAILYLRQTLRSGQTVSHKGHLVIIGDVNPGAEVMAEGDVTVWGALRGVAHAGIGGNLEAEIRALKLQPIQIRIAHAIARSPDKPRVKFARLANSGPETARIIDGKIKIAKSNIE